jgi:site-specific DNA-methyltransferase (adenine-specific)
VNRVLLGDNLPLLRELDDSSVQMVYADPPFNTGRTQTRRTLATAAARDGDGDRSGFGGRRYSTTLLAQSSYADSFDDYLGFLEPRLKELRRALAPTGTLYLHLDYREAHYVKLLLDEVFGRECFLNELIWAYDYGAKPRTRWPQKHDTILVYVRDPERYHFDAEAVDREPYMAPGLVTPEQRERGKRPTSVMWHTIVSPTGREKTGYPTQKPEALVRRFVQASSAPGDLCLDPFAGSGTLGAVAAALGRRFLLIDASDEAVAVMERRLAPALGAAVGDHPSDPTAPAPPAPSAAGRSTSAAPSAAGPTRGTRSSPPRPAP